MECYICFILYLKLDQQMSNWLFGRCRTLTTLLGKKMTPTTKRYSIMQLQIVSDTKYTSNSISIIIFVRRNYYTTK